MVHCGRDYFLLGGESNFSIAKLKIQIMQPLIGKRRNSLKTLCMSPICNNLYIFSCMWHLSISALMLCKIWMTIDERFRIFIFVNCIFWSSMAHTEFDSHICILFICDVVLTYILHEWSTVLLYIIFPEQTYTIHSIIYKCT